MRFVSFCSKFQNIPELKLNFRVPPAFVMNMTAAFVLESFSHTKSGAPPGFGRHSRVAFGCLLRVYLSRYVKSRDVTCAE